MDGTAVTDSEGLQVGTNERDGVAEGVNVSILDGLSDGPALGNVVGAHPVRGQPRKAVVSFLGCSITTQTRDESKANA